MLLFHINAALKPLKRSLTWITDDASKNYVGFLSMSILTLTSGRIRRNRSLLHTIVDRFSLLANQSFCRCWRGVILTFRIRYGTAYYFFQFMFEDRFFSITCGLRFSSDFYGVVICSLKTILAVSCKQLRRNFIVCKR